MLLIKYTESCQLLFYHFLIQFEQFLQNLASSVVQKIRAKKNDKKNIIFAWNEQSAWKPLRLPFKPFERDTLTSSCIRWYIPFFDRINISDFILIL